MNKWTLMGFMLGICLVTLWAFPAVADECSVRGGLGYVKTSVVSSNDWVNDPPAGLIGADCSFSLTERWGWGIEGLHISNAFDGAPFNNDPESSFDYYFGAYVKYVIWRE